MFKNKLTLLLYKKITTDIPLPKVVETIYNYK